MKLLQSNNRKSTQHELTLPIFLTRNKGVLSSIFADYNRIIQSNFRNIMIKKLLF